MCDKVASLPNYCSLICIICICYSCRPTANFQYNHFNVIIFLKLCLLVAHTITICDTNVSFSDGRSGFDFWQGQKYFSWPPRLDRLWVHESHYYYLPPPNAEIKNAWSLVQRKIIFVLSHKYISCEACPPL